MQFSLRTLFAAVAVVGIGAALWVAERSWYVGAVEFAFGAWVLTSAILLGMSHPGKPRAFWLGIATGIALPTIGWADTAIGISSHPYSGADPNHPLNQLQAFLFQLSINFRPLFLMWAFAPIVGLLCVLTHWLLVRPSSAEPKD